MVLQITNGEVLRTRSFMYLVIPSTSSLLVPLLIDDLAAGSYRVIGPEMPSADLLAAAAKLTEAEAELRSSS